MFGYYENFQKEKMEVFRCDIVIDFFTDVAQKRLWVKNPALVQSEQAFDFEPNDFTMMQYNILCEEYEDPNICSHISKEVLSHIQTYPKILQVVLFYSPDVICMQVLSQNYNSSTWNSPSTATPSLQEENHEKQKAARSSTRRKCSS